MTLAPALVSSLLSLAAASTDWQPVPLPQVVPLIQGKVTARLTPNAIELDVGVDGAVVQLAMPGIRGLELAVQTDGTFNFLYAAVEGGGSLWGPPARYIPLRPGATILRLDLVETAAWRPRADPVLYFDGAGRVRITSVRVLMPVSGAEAADVFDRAKLWEPESFGPTTVNFLTDPYWSASRGILLTEVLAGLAVVVAAGVLVAVRLRRGRWAPAPALVAAAVVAVGAWNLLFLLRYVPATDLAPSLDAEARIREGYGFAPELGEVAAAARTALRPEDRVGVVVPAEDWFVGQTLCYLLAPRRCVRVRAGEAEHAGISGVDHLRTDELDAVVSFTGAAGLPPGFAPRAQLTQRALIARRP